MGMLDDQTIDVQRMEKYHPQIINCTNILLHLIREAGYDIRSKPYPDDINTLTIQTLDKKLYISAWGMDGWTIKGTYVE